MENGADLKDIIADLSVVDADLKPLIADLSVLGADLSGVVLIYHGVLLI